jgi:hypothetical protein
VLRVAGETEITQENIQDCLVLDRGDPGFQLLTEEEIATVIFYLFSKFFFCLLELSFALLIRMTLPPINPN